MTSKLPESGEVRDRVEDFFKAGNIPVFDDVVRKTARHFKVEADDPRFRKRVKKHYVELRDDLVRRQRKSAIAKLLFMAVPFIACGILILLLPTDKYGDPLMPRWIGIALLVVGVFFYFIAQSLMFRKSAAQAAAGPKKRKPPAEKSG